METIGKSITIGCLGFFFRINDDNLMVTKTIGKNISSHCLNVFMYV